MKNYLVFTIVLWSASLRLFSCGYTPYGDDIRFALFLPEYFDYNDYQAFHYNASSFGFGYENPKSYASNIYDWYDYTNHEVHLESIYECLNTLTYTDIHKDSPNKFLQYLFKNKLTSAIQFITIAKKAEDFNSFESEEDPWERNESYKPNYTPLFQELDRYMQAEKSEYIQRKYAFLAIRTAYYAKDFNRIKTVFETYFAKGKKDYLYYWALFFQAFQNKQADLDIANLMAYSIEKKYASFFYFHQQFNLGQALRLAESSDDVANSYAYASVQRLEPNLDYLKKIYENTKDSRILDFLLLREINKIEDWVYTPYYTNYLPSIEFVNYYWTDNHTDVVSTNTLRQRSEKDRLYAKQVLDFVNTIDYAKVKDDVLWKAAQIQLLFITRSYETCLQKIGEFEQKHAQEKIAPQIEKIKALCLISNQEMGKAIITEEAQPIILKYLNDAHFLFALGRELEFRNNLSDGLALIAFSNKKVNYEEDNYFTNDIEWQGNRLKKSGNLKYFYEYFDYLDFVYSADELQRVVNTLNTDLKDDFHKTLYSQLIRDKNYLKDLLGTKYIREERLTKAEQTFKSIDQSYWEENYNAWERDRYRDSYTFDQNPFYDLKHTFSFIPHQEEYLVTKLSVTQHLIKYLKIAENPKTKNRDYYYFLIGNCYINMTQYGHAWMMRRFNSTTDYREGNQESFWDEWEYRNGYLAQKYYHLAYEHAQTDAFKALCLRMEDFAQTTGDPKFKKLKANYPNYYNDLSSCEHLETYFKKRR